MAGIIKVDTIKDSGDNTVISSNGSGTFTYAAASGANFTALNASNLGSGTVPTARLGSGTASSSVHLRGDQSWNAAGGGSWKFLQKQTASNSATITFTSTYLTNTYPVYRILVNSLRCANDEQQVHMHLSTDNGSSYISNYDQWQQGYNSGMGYNSGDYGANCNYAGQEFRAKDNAAFPLTMLGALGNSMGNGTGEGSVGEVTLYSFPNGRQPIVAFFSTMYMENTLLGSSSGFGSARTTSAINNFKFVANSGNLDTGTFTLYGMKDSA